MKYLYFQFSEVIIKTFTHTYPYLSTQMTLDKPFREHTITMLLLLIVLAEIFPEITVCFSVTKVRKLFNCTIFIVTGVIFLLVTFKVKTFLFLETEELFKFIFWEMEYFHNFGKRKLTWNVFLTVIYILTIFKTIFYSVILIHV